MYARVTLLEIDAVRTSMEGAVRMFNEQVLPRLRSQPGYRGIYVLTTPEGKAALVSLWASEEAADASADSGFYAEELASHATMFRSPPGRDRYEVTIADVPHQTARAG